MGGLGSQWVYCGHPALIFPDSVGVATTVLYMLVIAFAMACTAAGATWSIFFFHHWSSLSIAAFKPRAIISSLSALS